MTRTRRGRAELWLALWASLLIGACGTTERDTPGTGAGEAAGAMTEPLDFATLKKAESPNRWLVAPDGFLDASAPDAPAPRFEASASEVYEALLQVIDAERAYSDLETDRAARRIAFVATVPVFGFKDDVDIAVIEDTGTTTLAIYSRSRVGYSDFGVNKRRVETIISRLREALER